MTPENVSLPALLIASVTAFAMVAMPLPLVKESSPLIASLKFMLRSAPEFNDTGLFGENALAAPSASVPPVIVVGPE